MLQLILNSEPDEEPHGVLYRSEEPEAKPTTAEVASVKADNNSE